MFRLSCVVVAIFIAMSAAALAARPNVIVLVIDDARPDDLTTMPVARSLGEAGASFENAFAPFPLCCPARATLLTGQYAHNHGVTSNKRPTGGFWLFRDDDTLATWLDPNYVTGWAGKYLNEYGSDGSATYVPPGWDEWFAPALGFTNYANTTWNWNRVLRNFPGEYQTDTLADFAVNFVNQYASGSRPFFLVVSFVAPHAGSPIEPDDPQIVFGTTHFPTPAVAPRHRNAFAGRPLVINPAFNEADMSDKRKQPALLEPWEVLALTEVDQQRRESLLAVDEAIERLLQTLHRRGVLENTYIMLLSDNSYAMGEHRYRNGKNMLYDAAVKIPLLMQGPGIRAGCRVSQSVGIQDLAPTILAMTSTKAARGSLIMDGVDLLPMCVDPRYHADRPIVIEAAPENGGLTPDWLFQGVITPQWKFVQRSTGGIELYDRVADPWELQNQAQNPLYDAIKSQLRQLNNRLKTCQGDACWR